MRQLSRLSMAPAAQRSSALATNVVASIAADYESSCPIVYRELIDPALEAGSTEGRSDQGDVTGILVAALCEIQAQLPEGSATPANDPQPAPDSARGPITERSTPWPLDTGTLVGPGAAWPRAVSWQDVAWEHDAGMRALPPGDRAAVTQRAPRHRGLRAPQLLVAGLVAIALLGLVAFAWLKLLAHA